MFVTYFCIKFYAPGSYCYWLYHNNSQGRHFVSIHHKVTLTNDACFSKVYHRTKFPFHTVYGVSYVFTY
jgi:hypothetical protein